MLDEHDKKSMLSAMLTRVGPFFVEVELATRPARSTGDDCACIWPAGVSRMRRDRHAQGYGRIGDAGATGLPELRTSLRGQHSGPAIPANGRINLLHYMGDEGSILCKLQFGPDLTNEAFVSITQRWPASSRHCFALVKWSPCRLLPCGAVGGAVRREGVARPERRPTNGGDGHAAARCGRRSK